MVAFNVAFNPLAYKVKWNANALLDIYREKLNWKWPGKIEDICKDKPRNLGNWQHEAAKFERDKLARTSQITILEMKKPAKTSTGPNGAHRLNRPYIVNLDKTGKLKAEVLQARKDAGKGHRCGEHPVNTPCKAGTLPICNLRLNKDKIEALSKNY